MNIVKISTSTTSLILFVFVSLYVEWGSAARSVAEECSSELQKVTACLGFATGKAATPTKECCGAVTEIKESDPVCLCYIIEQIHNGTNPQLKSMGIQEPRLLQLPSSCKLANASSSDCPKLLHLAPNSPEAAIFTNLTASTSPTTPSTGNPSASSSNGSDGYKSVPQLAGSMKIAILILFYVAMSA